MIKNSLFFLLAATILPAMLAQSPVTLALAPIQPTVLPDFGVPNGFTVTPSVGSITLSRPTTTGNGTITMSVQAPQTVAATDLNFYYNLNPPGNFIFTVNVTGFPGGIVYLSPNVNGDPSGSHQFTDFVPNCQVIGNNSTTCAIPYIYKVNNTPQTVGVAAVAQIDTGGIVPIKFAIAFQWSTSGAATSGDLGDSFNSTFFPTCPGHTAVPDVTKPHDTSTLSPPLTNNSGSTTLATGTWTLKCSSTTAGGSCSYPYTISVPSSGQDWFKITSPLTGTVTDAKPAIISMTADASKLSAGTYNAQFTADTSPECPSCPKTRTVVFDVLPPCPTKDSIDFQLSFPSQGEVVIDNPLKNTPSFFAVVDYSLNSTNRGKIELQLQDQNGKTIAAGLPVGADMGAHTAGQTACIGANKVNCLYTSPSKYLDTSKTLLLTAVLQDLSGKVLAQTSPPISYPIAQAKVSLALGSQTFISAFTPAPAGTVLEGGRLLGDTTNNIDGATIEASYDFPGQSGSIRVITFTDQGQINITDSVDIHKGSDKVYFTLKDLKLPTMGTLVRFAAELDAPSILPFRLPPIEFPLEAVDLYPNALGMPMTEQPPRDAAVELGKETGFFFPLIFNARPGGAKLNATLSWDDGSDKFPSQQVPGGPGTQSGTGFETLSQQTTQLKFQATLGSGTTSALSSPVIYKNFGTTISGGFGAFVSGTIKTLAGKIQSAAANKIGDSISNYLNKHSAKPNAAGLHPLARSASQASSSLPDWIGINSTWQFDPPIPADGTFSATLTLSYTSTELPDDPNFTESKLQIVSYNPSTGNFNAYTTTLDLTNRQATAQINSLEPYYSLAVIGPFSKTMLNLPGYNLANGSDTKLALVNTGSADSQLTVRGYGVNGSSLSGSPLSPKLGANKQLVSSVVSLGFDSASLASSGWVQIPADTNTVNGIETIGNGVHWEALPLVSGHVNSAVLTDIELDDTYSTEIHVVNPGTDSRSLTLTLYASNGTLAGTYTSTLDPKGVLVGHAEVLFPSMPNPFTGYVIVSGDGDVLASALVSSFANISAVGGHPSASGGSATLYGPQLGAAGQFTRVILVNTGTTDANLVFTGYQTNGSVLGNPVAMKLGAGKQIISDLSAVFNYDPNAPPGGWFKVVSDQPIFGDLTFGDASFYQRTRASIPLSGTPVLNSVLPFAENDSRAATTVSIANPNGSAAVVMVTTFTTNGTQASSTTANVPANGFTTSTISTPNLNAGYVTLSSAQGIVAFATVAPVSGSDFAAFTAQAIPAAPSGGAATPQINSSVNAASFVSKLARGSIATLFGSNFMIGQPVSAGSLPLATVLGGVSVTVGGVPAPLIYVSSGQINFQVPYEVPAGTSASVVVKNNGASSLSFNVAIADYAVGVFTYARTAQSLDPIIVHNATNALVTPTNPAVPNEFLVIYATGIGKLSSQPPSGAPATGLSSAVDTPTITVGGTAARVLYAGLTPGFPGLVQFNVQLAASLPTGSLPVVITFPGDSTTPVNLAVQGNIASAPKLSLSSATLAFGNVTVGQTKDLSLLVSNNGTATLNVNSASVSGAGFNLTSGSSFAVTPGGSQTLTVRYSPTSAIASTGILTIASNDAASPATVSLSGNGVAATSGSAQCTGGGPGGFGVTLAGGPVCTEITNGVCPTTQPVSFSTLGTSDPNITVWYELNGLSPSSSVLTRFSFNGTVIPSLDYGPFGPNFFQGGTYVLCPGIVPNASGAGNWAANVFLNGSSTPAFTFTFTVSPGSGSH